MRATLSKIAVAGTVLALLFPALLQAQVCADPPHDRIPDVDLKTIATGLNNPTHIADDGSGRLFVVEQPGTIRIIENGELLPEPFLDLRDRVEWGGEKGLLSIAFHPRYRENGIFFVDYTTHVGGLHTHVSRFKTRNPRQADLGSETVLLRIKQPFSNHNGGQLAFGPDGYLYIGMGDGGSANDPHNNGQDLSTLLGALLRIDVDKTQGKRPYGIPKDNPFVGRKGARGEIFAYGLRNPWRFSFDPLNGRLYLADVGQDRQEEIDVIEKGGNYGWRIMEGFICTPGVEPICDKSALALPIFAYEQPLGMSITGGFVYRGGDIPDLCGTYLYADYVTQRLWGLRYNGEKVVAQRQLLRKAGHVSSFGRDAQGEIYITDHQAGRILRLVAD